MNDIGNKERIIAILSKFESGLTYKNLLERYKEEYNEELENGYVYLKRLKEKGIIETYKTPNIKGKNLTYRLKSEHKESQESDILAIQMYSFLSKKCKIVEEIIPSEIRMLENIKRLSEEHGYIRTS